MIKKWIVFFSVCLTLLSTVSFATHRTLSSRSADIKSGFGLAMNWATYNENDFALMLAYDNKLFTTGFGFNYKHYDSISIPDVSGWFEWRYHLGLRYILCRRLFAVGGITGSFTTNQNDPYSIGPYVGLDYYLLRRLFLSFKILPYSYKRTFYFNDKVSSVFEDGSISLTYTF